MIETEHNGAVTSLARWAIVRCGCGQKGYRRGVSRVVYTWEQDHD